MTIRRAGVFICLFLATNLFLPNAFGQQNARSATKQKPSVESAYTEMTKVPEKAWARRNPLEKDPDAIAAGRILFDLRCAECHGDNGEGGKKGPSLRAYEIQDAEPGAIFWILTNGVVRKGMPVWSKLPEAQRWQLISFIKSLGPVPAKTETPPAGASRSSSTKDSTSQPR